MIQNRADLLAAENQWQALWASGTDHPLEPLEIAPEQLPVKKQQSAEGLVLG
jgi:hypothetical protein